MIVFCCVLPASNKARDDDDDDVLIESANPRRVAVVSIATSE